jgi:NAD(P)-dependent dehydrogenase (short-subunit alcohol dehydrogenase family)
VNVASTFHFNVIGGIPYDQVHDPPQRPLRRMDLMPGGFYPASKLAVVAFTLALGEKLKGSGVVVHAVHPGHVATGNEYENIIKYMQREKEEETLFLMVCLFVLFCF